MNTLSISIAAGIILLIAIIILSYVKTPPQVALIISGLSKTPRVLIGKGGFRIPFF
jgi:flotillin